MKLENYIDEYSIYINVPGNNIQEVTDFILNQEKKKNSEIEKEFSLIRDALNKREQQASTYLDAGIAIPHCKLDYFDDIYIGIGILEKPFIMKDVLDNPQEVSTVILIIADILESKKILKIMSGISRMILNNENNIKFLSTLKSPQEILNKIKEINIDIDHNIIAEDLYNCEISPVKLTDTLEYVATKIVKEKIMGLPVVDENNTFLGEVTEKELIEFGMPKYINLLNDVNFLAMNDPFEHYLINEKFVKVEEIYKKENVISVEKKTPLMEICYLFMSKGVTRIYVTENQKYVGIIFRSDIIKKILHV
ncbi:MAG: CBS domain-containing protein [Cetobacterium sp.]